MPLDRGGASDGCSARLITEPMPSAPMRTSPSADSPFARCRRTRLASAVNPTASEFEATASKPAASSSAPCKAGRSAIGPPSASRSGNTPPLRTVPSIRRTSTRMRTGANARASTTAARPSSRSAAMALGASPTPKPSSRGDSARSKMRTSQPARRSATPADRPPIPAPTMSATDTSPRITVPCGVVALRLSMLCYALIKSINGNSRASAIDPVVALRSDL